MHLTGRVGAHQHPCVFSCNVDVCPPHPPTQDPLVEDHPLGALPIKSVSSMPGVCVGWGGGGGEGEGERGDFFLSSLQLQHQHLRGSLCLSCH